MRDEQQSSNKESVNGKTGSRGQAQLEIEISERTRLVPVKSGSLNHGLGNLHSMNPTAVS